MPALFEVPGWSVPSKPVGEPSHNHKKRKRGHDQSDKIHAAETNIEKLLEKMGSNSGPTGEQRKKKQKTKTIAKSSPSSSTPKRPSNANSKTKDETRKHQLDKKGSLSPTKAEQSTTPNTKKDKKRKPESTPNDGGGAASSKKKGSLADSSGLTLLQANMKSSLDGARFRWINETLYKSDSHTAVEMMKENPSIFNEYHTGFRHQVQSWPKNPVAHYISSLSKLPKSTVIADLGCGDAALARALVPEGYTVLSYDLVSNNEYVVEADICAKIPLPGGDREDEEHSGGQVVDIVVCALSLMGTNWTSCIREAWRVLKHGGELRIAEVASRFTDVEEFTSLISSIGFKLRSKDDSNTHFTLLDFVKVKRQPKSLKEWEKITGRGDLLKPCEYKRR